MTDTDADACHSVCWRLMVVNTNTNADAHSTTVWSVTRIKGIVQCSCCVCVSVCVYGCCSELIAAYSRWADTVLFILRSTMNTKMMRRWTANFVAQDPRNRTNRWHIIFIADAIGEESISNFPSKYSWIFTLELFYVSHHLGSSDTWLRT